MNTAELLEIRGPHLNGFNREIQALAVAIGGVQDFMEMQADLIPDDDDALRPVFAGAAQLLNLIREKMECLGMDIGAEEAAGRL